MQSGKATKPRVTFLRLSIGVLLLAVLAWSWSDRLWDTSTGSAGSEGEASEHDTPAGQVSPVATGERELTFDDQVHRGRRQEYVETLKDDPLARLAPRWDSLYTGLDATADSASLAIKFRELDSLWDISGSDEQL